MPRLALAYKSSFKMNPAALCARTKAENIPAMHWSTLLLAQRACWDRAAQPSPDAGPQPTGPDLKSVTSAYMCPSMYTMWSGSDNNMCIWNHIHALCLFPLLILGFSGRYFKVWVFSPAPSAPLSHLSTRRSFSVFVLCTGHRADGPSAPTHVFRLSHRLFQQGAFSFEAVRLKSHLESANRRHQTSN